jgi:hypothetical protein
MDSVRRWRARLLLIGTGVAFPGAEAHAQARALTLAQFAHRTWTARDGAPGAVNALAQTPDGYLWLGTGAGLYRFDGVHFEPFAPPPGQVMPSRVIGVLRALPDGSLWIGYSSGGASVLAGGRLVSYGPEEGLPPVTVNALARDSTGTMWAATMDGVARLTDGRWHRVGPECGYPGGATADLLVDRRGTVWAAEFTGVYALPRGARRFVRRAPSLATGVGDAGNGSLREDPTDRCGARRSRSARSRSPTRSVARRRRALAATPAPDGRTSSSTAGATRGASATPACSCESRSRPPRANEPSTRLPVGVTRSSSPARPG